ncbi:helix-turn-helix domain-containing protein [Alkalihalobacillus sp. 1P02AB]|uniref:helix-turn-helix domain-containing protein n=1 Tax=Alkalihalobacillus sp. 1P02AB TaxID=3132260 RepID=UPI0039A582A5
MEKRENKKGKLIKRIEQHLRKTARHLVQFDSEEETLQYLIDSFQAELSTEFVGIFLKDEQVLFCKVVTGATGALQELNFSMEDCPTHIMNECLTFQQNSDLIRYPFAKLLKQQDLSTWFTVPIKDEMNSYGICVIGYRQNIPLFMEMEKVFEEFGKDIALSISLVRQKINQKQKWLEMDWLSHNLLIDSSLDEVIHNILERAAKGTNANYAYMYLYNEHKNCFEKQASTYGKGRGPEFVYVDSSNQLKNSFPYLGLVGECQLSIPLIVDLNTIGVIHIEHNDAYFTDDDRQFVDLLSNHVSVMIENGRLYQNERAHKVRLNEILQYQQSLMKETINADNFEGITKQITQLFQSAVILTDRFMRPISHECGPIEKERFFNLLTQMKEKNLLETDKDLVVDNIAFSVWPIHGGGQLLGYLFLSIEKEEIDHLVRLSIELARNIYSVQFIKQKRMVDAKEQMKQSLVQELLVEKIEQQDRIIQYAHLFNWDLFAKHRIVSLSIQFKQTDDDNVLKRQEMRTKLSDLLKERLAIYDKDMLLSNIAEEYVIIIPHKKEGKDYQKFYQEFYQKMRSWLVLEKWPYCLFIGVGGVTTYLRDYFLCYQQAKQALSIAMNHMSKKGLAYYEELDSYVLLHEVKGQEVSTLFIQKYLDPILIYSEERKVDLFFTLRMYLNNNGHIQQTADALYIHRSSLLYRLEKMESLLSLSLNDSDVRFNLMLALKLYDLNSVNPSYKMLER